MDESQAKDFLRRHGQAVFVTLRKDGRAQTSNVLAVYDEHKLLVSTSERSAKYRNLVQDPRAGLHVLGDHFGEYLAVEGTASFERLPEAHAALRRYYEKATGAPHPNWEEYDLAMRNEQRVLLSISIERMYPLVH